MRAALTRISLMLAIIAGVATLAKADSQVRIVRLSYINGQVQVDRGQGAGYEQALPNMPIVEGLKVSTGSDGVAEVEFEDGSTFRITPETEIEVRQLALEDSGATLSTVALLHGTAYIDFRKHKEDVFNLVLPNQEVALNHQVRVRVEVAQDEAELAVFSGELDLTGSSEVLRVKKNESVTLDFSNASQYTLAKEIDPAPYDDWSNEREKYRERYASTIDHTGSTPAYGLADLAYYGDSFDLPGYGWVWQPYGIGAGWNPFYSGYWNYYPATGWMWCSYAPWGWYPYRYGSWAFAPGYGWVWSPGRTFGTGWHPIPPVMGAPSGFRPPVRPIRPPISPRSTVIAVGERPVFGPGHRPYDPADPVLAVHGSGWRKEGSHNNPGKPTAMPSTSAAKGSSTTSGSTTAAGGVSTFTPATTPATTSSNDNERRTLRPGGVPASVRDLRRDINTPENQSVLGEMRHDDTYNRNLHREMERNVPAYASGPPATGNSQPAVAPNSHHERALQPPSGGAPPSWSHGNSAPARQSGGAFSGGAPSHSSGGAPMGGGGMHSSGGGASMGGGGGHPSGGGGGGHSGGGRPPR